MCGGGGAYQRHLVPSCWWAVSRVNSRAVHPSSPPHNTKSRARFRLNPDREEGETGRVNISCSRFSGRKGEGETTKTKTSSSHENAHMMRHKQGLTLAAVVAGRGCRLIQCVGLDRPGRKTQQNETGGSRERDGGRAPVVRGALSFTTDKQ